MTIYVFTPQGNLVVYEEPWRIVKTKVASGSYAVDTYEPNPGYRYGRIKEGH